MKRPFSVATLLLACSGLLASACGQKGPLSLPKPSASASAPAGTASAAPAGR